MKRSKHLNETRMIKSYLTDYEYKRVSARAKANNVSISQYVKLVLNAVDDANVKRNREKQEISDKQYHDLIIELKRIGTNLNQIARNSNRGLDVDDDLKNWINRNIKILQKVLRNVSY